MRRWSCCSVVCCWLACVAGDGLVGGFRVVWFCFGGGAEGKEREWERE